jgi:hypothetical protein
MSAQSSSPTCQSTTTHTSGRRHLHVRGQIKVTQNHSSSREQCSSRTVPVWLKSNGKKVKVNAILDDASNESFSRKKLFNLFKFTF